MKINLNDIPREGLLKIETIIAGEKCTLITLDHIGFDWTPDNLHFRSSMWNSDGELISASFKKFFNWEEKPAITPQPGDNDYCEAIEKLDGSALIISEYKGESIIRTRGAVNVSAMPNADEIDYFKIKYPNLFNDKKQFQGHSYIFEWVSPKNRIIIEYPEPELYLIAGIKHENYSMLPQCELDLIATANSLKRPRRFNFTSRSLLFKDVSEWDDKEGICLYYNDGQSIRKIKSLKYVKKHAFKSLLSLKNLAKIYYEYGLPNKDEFEARLEKEFDFECAQMAVSMFDPFFKAFLVYKEKIDTIAAFVENNKNLDQKSFAMKLNSEPLVKSNSYLSGFGFAMRKGVFDIKDTEKTFLMFF